MNTILNVLKKYIWFVALHASRSYSRYGMYEPKKPINIEKYTGN